MPQVFWQIAAGSTLGHSFKDFPDSLALVGYCLEIGFVLDRSLY
jgi:hypothetical protein